MPAGFTYYILEAHGASPGFASMPTNIAAAVFSTYHSFSRKRSID